MDALTPIQQELSFIWWIALGLSFMLYIILDGSDLGAGIFSLFVRDEDERGAIMAAMAGTWDANETWLVVAGGIIFGSFPLVYGSAFHYLMLPLMLTLLSIILRAVALEFRVHSDFSKRFWDWCFGIASLTVTFFAGMGLGGLLQGFPLTAGPVPTYAGGALNFFSLFSLWIGVAAVIAAALAGGIFLRVRFERHTELYHAAQKWVDVMFYLALAAVLITLVWSYFKLPWASAKWTGPHWWAWWLLGAAVVFCAVRMRMASIKQHDMSAMLWLSATIIIMWGGMMATMYPWLVPDTWTIYSGANPSNSLVAFTLAVGGFIPVMIMYNWYQIWVFRGRITKLAAYEHH
ncbi:cytochrome d ubiquinol oxidase subunit II [Acidihalobacter ferrooxydans]|uniref:Cytochrome D ubiquinol oxidase subunit II n=1 Tax=Acidihalobacter ferrooxydans TaxID=1765967 RepID=A0A1P8UIS9_9GAMM|nr:cytochrome d ubiquinol oxidase subunit II [Acidihalobacter ferrooxydans]APZ43730.1 cytochrome D ubiquinol oxidase subunit II [Acidihalobacter ferrooxydans]